MSTVYYLVFERPRCSKVWTRISDEKAASTGRHANISLKRELAEDMANALALKERGWDFTVFECKEVGFTCRPSKEVE